MIKEIVFDWEGVLEVSNGFNLPLFYWIKNNQEFSFSILSNCFWDLTEKLKEIEAKEFFNHIITAQNSNFLKPERKAFLFLLDKTKRNPEDIFFIDDNPNNVKSAKQLKINGYLFKNNQDLIQELERL